MKGKVVMRFVGNRQEPESDPEPLKWEEIVFVPPPLPLDLLSSLEWMKKQAEKITGGTP